MCHESCWVEAVVDAGGGTSVEGLACWVRNCVNLRWLSGFGSDISESLSTLVNASPKVWMSAWVGRRYRIMWRRLNSFCRAVTMVVALSWVPLPIWRSDRSRSASRSAVYLSGCISTAGAFGSQHEGRPAVVISFHTSLNYLVIAAENYLKIIYQRGIREFLPFGRTV